MYGKHLGGFELGVPAFTRPSGPSSSVTVNVGRHLSISILLSLGTVSVLVFKKNLSLVFMHLLYSVVYRCCRKVQFEFFFVSESTKYHLSKHRAFSRLLPEQMFAA